MMRSALRRFFVLVLAVSTVAGCSGGEPDRATTGRTGESVSARPPARPAFRVVHFKANDGRRVAGRYTAAGRGAPAVVLLHEVNSDASQWDSLVPYLRARGFATLAYDSRPSRMEGERLPDLIGAVRWLRGRDDVDRDRVGIVGASIGASTAVLAMATHVGRRVDAAVALSPPDSSDIWALQDAKRYHPHDMLLVSDDREASSANGMLEGAVRSRALKSERPGHGVVLLEHPGIRQALVAWLEKRVR